MTPREIAKAMSILAAELRSRGQDHAADKVLRAFGLMLPVIEEHERELAA